MTSHKPGLSTMTPQSIYSSLGSTGEHEVLKVIEENLRQQSPADKIHDKDSELKEKKTIFCSERWGRHFYSRFINAFVLKSQNVIYDH